MFIVGCWYERPCIVVAGACWWFVPVAGAGTNVPVLRSLLPCWCWLLLQGAGGCWCWCVVAWCLLVCSYRVLVCGWCWYERPCIEVATTLLVVRACCWCVVAGAGTNVPVSWLLVLVCSYRVLVCGCWCWYERPCIEVATTLLVVRACCWCVVAGAGTNVPVSWLLVLAGCSYRVLVCGCWCWYERPCIVVAGACWLLLQGAGVWLVLVRTSLY